MDECVGQDLVHRICHGEFTLALSYASLERLINGVEIFRADDGPLARVRERQVGFERVMQLLGLLRFTL